MSKAKKNAERERRIEMEIIVDAYGPEEQARGGGEVLRFVFRKQDRSTRRTDFAR